MPPQKFKPPKTFTVSPETRCIYDYSLSRTPQPLFLGSETQWKMRDCICLAKGFEVLFIVADTEKFSA